MKIKCPHFRRNKNRPHLVDHWFNGKCQLSEVLRFDSLSEAQQVAVDMVEEILSAPEPSPEQVELWRIEEEVENMKLAANLYLKVIEV
jgi:hypothetical protein